MNNIARIQHLLYPGLFAVLPVIHFTRKMYKGPVTLPTIVVLRQKVRSNLVSIVQFLC